MFKGDIAFEDHLAFDDLESDAVAAVDSAPAADRRSVLCQAQGHEYSRGEGNEKPNEPGTAHSSRHRDRTSNPVCGEHYGGEKSVSPQKLTEVKLKDFATGRKRPSCPSHTGFNQSRS